MNKVIWMEFTA